MINSFWPNFHSIWISNIWISDTMQKRLGKKPECEQECYNKMLDYKHLAMIVLAMIVHNINVHIHFKLSNYWQIQHLHLYQFIIHFLYQ